MVRTIVATIYILVWGVVTIVIVLRDGRVPPEYWTLPAIGLGALVAALGPLDKKIEDNRKKLETTKPKNDTAEELP